MKEKIETLFIWLSERKPKTITNHAKWYVELNPDKFKRTQER
jgi:hypothetical protein